MAKNDVKVLGLMASPFVSRVLMALKIKSVKYEFLESNPHQKNDFLAKCNPVHKKIPVLIHAGKPISESLVIVQYIDDTWTNGPSILPSDPYDRAIARFWGAYLDEKWFPLFKQLKEAQGEEAKKAVRDKLISGLVLLDEAFVKCSKGKAFFGGDHVGYVDIALGCQVGWMQVIEILSGTKLLDAAKTPNLVGWAERLYSDSSVKDAMMETEELLELFKKLQAMNTAASD